MSYKTFGEEFSDFLKKNHMTCNAVGNAINVPANRISDIVRNRRGVTAETSFLLGRLFEMEADHFIRRYNSYLILQELESRFEKGEVSKEYLDHFRTANEWSS